MEPLLQGAGMCVSGTYGMTETMPLAVTMSAIAQDEDVEKPAGAEGAPRSPLALLLFVSAGLAHVGLYRDARHLRTTGVAWSPRYWRYSLAGAGIALGGLLLVDATVPGGTLGAAFLSFLGGILLTAPVYLFRRYRSLR